MYKINFFTLVNFDSTKDFYFQKKYIEKLLKFEFELSNLVDVKSFLCSNFYTQFSHHIDEEPYINGQKLNGIVINLFNDIVYKEILYSIYNRILDGDLNFKIYQDKKNRTVYEIVSEEKGFKDTVLINKLGEITK